MDVHAQYPNAYQAPHGPSYSYASAGQRTAYAAPQPTYAAAQPIQHQPAQIYQGAQAQQARVIPSAAMGVDLNRDGRPDLMVAGADYNQDGIPDALQQQGMGYGTGPSHAPTQQYAATAVEVQPEYQEEPLRVSMVVPEGAAPGTKLQVAAPDGQELRLTVPEGVPPGSTMTLTQDPNTKQWRCMAEPAETPAAAPPPAQQTLTYETPAGGVSQHQPHQQPCAATTVNSYTAPAPQPPQSTLDRVTTYVSGQPPVVTTYSSAGQVPTVTTLPRQIVSTLPVNLSYVPPPAQTSMHMAPGQVTIAAGAAPAAACGVDPSCFNPPRQMPGYADGQVTILEQRPSYTPPPVTTVMEQRPSYTPLPQVVTAGPAMQGMPRVVGPVIEPGLLATTGKVNPQQITQGMAQQTPSYVPPPVAIVQNNHSYVPPVQLPTVQTTVQYDGTVIGASSAQLPVQGPSITLPAQQQPHQMMAMGHQMGMQQQSPGVSMMQCGGSPPMQLGTAGLPPIGLPPINLPPIGAPPMGPMGHSMGQLPMPGGMAGAGQGLGTSLGASPSFMQGGMQTGMMGMQHGMMGSMHGSHAMGSLGPPPPQMSPGGGPLHGGQAPPMQGMQGPGQPPPMQGMQGQMPYGMGYPGSCPAGGPCPYPPMMQGPEGGMPWPPASHGPDGMPLGEGPSMPNMMQQMPMMGAPQ